MQSWTTLSVDALSLRSTGGDGTLERFVSNTASHPVGAVELKAVNCLTRLRLGVKSVVATQYGLRKLEVLNFGGIVPLVCEQRLALSQVTALVMQGVLNRW